MKSKLIRVEDDEFGLVLNCAVRYCLGRRTYMPSSVIRFITPLIPQLTTRTLYVFKEDIEKREGHGGYGDENIDKPDWMKFLDEVSREIQKRGG